MIANSGSGTRIIICGDDYGLSRGVNEAILSLLGSSRLSATSCMTLFPEWVEDAKRLKPFLDTSDVGLHLTLTDFEPLGRMPVLAAQGRLPSLKSLIMGCNFRRWDPAEISQEIERQLDAFEEAFGRPPSHLDGHQHIHLLPQIREPVLDLFERRLKGSGTYVRNCGDSSRNILARGSATGKAFTLNLLGARFHSKAKRAGLTMNKNLTGLYDFRGDSPYSDLFPRFLIGAGNNTMLLCHPGEVDSTLRRRDHLREPREAELAFFKSDQFLELMQQAGLETGRLTWTL